MAYIHYYNILQSIFTALKILYALPIHLSPTPAPGNPCHPSPHQSTALSGQASRHFICYLEFCSLALGHQTSSGHLSQARSIRVTSLRIWIQDQNSTLGLEHGFLNREVVRCGGSKAALPVLHRGQDSSWRAEPWPESRGEQRRAVDVASVMQPGPSACFGYSTCGHHEKTLNPAKDFSLLFKLFPSSQLL